MTGALAVLGTGSDVGKSLIATALGRLLADAGLDVAPFKAQNMANQAGVTIDGGEMPRAQVLQARACRQAPHVDMGPVLLKPVTETGAQVVVLGRARAMAEARTYFADTGPLAAVAADALRRLASRHEVLVLEGAGSPVEVNLLDRDFVNLRPAAQVGAALVLVADVHRGGVFAQVKGTVDLLPPADRARLLGVIVNRFRGDPALFEDGVRALEALAGVPVLAVVTHLDHGLDEEDRPLPVPVDRPAPPGMLGVGALLSPRVANTEDLWPLLAEPDVHLTWVTEPRIVPGLDLLVLPGSKATIADLAHHTATGLAEAVGEAAGRGAWVLGLCGGYQMLGRHLADRAGTEGGPASWPGLGLLPLDTVFAPAKQVAQRSFESRWPVVGCQLSGYEIHHGRTGLSGPAVDGRWTVTDVEGDGGGPGDAARASDDAPGEPLVADGGAEVGWRRARVAGCYLHGLLAHDGWRAAFLNEVRRDRGRPLQPVRPADPLDLRIDRWARHVRRSLRGDAWARILDAVRGRVPASCDRPRASSPDDS